jgi:basic membrane protein A
MKKNIALLLAVLMVFALVACASKTATSTTSAAASSAAASTPAATSSAATSSAATSSAASSSAATSSAATSAAASDFKVGAVLVGDENEGYTYAHIVGLQEALKNNGLSDSNIIWKYSIGETEACYDACTDCVDNGCKLVITNSFGHQSYCQQAASENPDVQFVSMTGNTAKSAGLANFHNAFTRIYEARYVGGIVAGMKLQELIDAGKLTDANKDSDGNYKIGYVGAYPYAEVVSGYTAFFLGIRSIVKNVSMQVQYTNSWFDITAEGEAANALIADGCCIIGQHADSTGAPAACEAALKAGKVVYSVGYNVDMLSVAPTAALTSPTNEWGVFYTYAVKTVMEGGKLDTDWAEGFSKDAVAITKLGDSCAKGTQEAVDKAIADIKADKLHVFDTSTFTVGGKAVTNAFATDTNGDFTNDADEAIIDGYYHESYFQSAPSFSLRIDGIKELNAN